MKKRLIVTIIIAFAAMLLFAGCGGSDSGSGDQSSDDSNVAEEQSSDDSNVAEDQSSDDGSETADSSILSFETTDLEGNTITSKDLFSKNKVTMVNNWATFCGPCIQEMPELEELNKELASRGGAIVGLVCDVPLGDDSLLGDAKDIVKDTGVTYVNLRAWDGFDEVVSLTAVPTSYFVDSEGNIIGEPIVGAYVDEYRSTFDELLE